MLARLPRLLMVCVVLGGLLIAPVAPVASGSRDAAFDRLVGALRIDDTLAIMRREGVLYGVGLAQDMIPRSDVESWRRRVGRLYDPQKLRRQVEDRLAAELDGVDLQTLTGFFTSSLGRRVIELELSAREAFLDPGIEATARALHAEMARDGKPVIGQIDRIVDDSDLISRNVSGILNANLMLYRGLADGGASDMSEAEMLREVWAQEDGVRTDSAGWIGAYLLTAYRPLERQELERYIAFWRSREGQALNRALFAAFDAMYEELSYLLGLALADHMRGEKL